MNPPLEPADSSAAEMSAPSASRSTVPSAAVRVPPESSLTTAAWTAPRFAGAPPTDHVSRPASITGTSTTSPSATTSRPRDVRLPVGTVPTAIAPAPAGTGAGTRPNRPATLAPDGHHARSPTSVVIAGTRMERTRNVSMSTPIATATPIWNRIVSGAVTIEPNVPARMMPAEVMTAPVCPDAIRTASRIGRVSCLLADAVHQEDVVVGPERHEQHEQDQRAGTG